MGTDVVQIEFIASSLEEANLVGSFNTFRKGSKWAYALNGGEAVELIVCEEPGGEPFAIVPAMVSRVVKTRLGDALQQHVIDNHGVNNDFTNVEESRQKLAEILVGCYGANTSTDVFTVVYLTVDPRLEVDTNGT